LLAGDTAFEDGLGIMHYCRLGDMLRFVDSREDAFHAQHRRAATAETAAIGGGGSEGALKGVNTRGLTLTGYGVNPTREGYGKG